MIHSYCLISPHFISPSQIILLIFMAELYSLTLLSNVNCTQCHWLLYSHDDFCRDTLYYISNCRMIIRTNLFCNNFLNVQPATSHIYIFNNTALLADIVHCIITMFRILILCTDLPIYRIQFLSFIFQRSLSSYLMLLNHWS